MHQIVLHLGSNMGYRNANRQRAPHLITEATGAECVTSAIYETSAWGLENQRDFLNQALLVETTLSAQEALELALNIESQLGRQRKQKWGERLIDIDLIFFDQLVVQQPRLTLPHPWMQQRRFVLYPLAEIIPQWHHPVLQQSVIALLHHCTDEGQVKRVSGWN